MLPSTLHDQAGAFVCPRITFISEQRQRVNSAVPECEPTFVISGQPEARFVLYKSRKSNLIVSDQPQTQITKINHLIRNNGSP
jgi:hypothetical protein